MSTFWKLGYAAPALLGIFAFEENGVLSCLVPMAMYSILHHLSKPMSLIPILMLTLYVAAGTCVVLAMNHDGFIMTPVKGGVLYAVFIYLNVCVICVSDKPKLIDPLMATISYSSEEPLVKNEFPTIVCVHNVTTGDISFKNQRTNTWRTRGKLEEHSDA